MIELIQLEGGLSTYPPNPKTTMNSSPMEKSKISGKLLTPQGMVDPPG